MPLARFFTALLTALVCISPLAAADTPAAPKPDQAGWRTLFNGKDLTGWKPIGTAVWKAEDGILTGGQDGDPKKSGLLTTTDQFQDFELVFDFMIDEHGQYNSGVYLRNDPNTAKRSGYQINIGRGVDGEYCGGLHLDDWLAKGDEKDEIRKPREWNAMRITAKAGHITVDLNGKKVVDYTDPKPDAKLIQKGVIGFQTYGAQGHAGWVKFRNIKIREISDAKDPATSATPTTPTAQPDEVTPVFTSGADGYHTYRIPSIIATKKGTLLAFAEARKAGRGDAGNIDLVLKRSHDQGKTWGPMQIIWDDANHTCGNPCPVIDQATGNIILLLTWNRGDDHEGKIMAGTANDTRRVFVASSTDDGITWSKPTDITASAKDPQWRWYATGPGIGIQMKEGPHKGRLVIPCDHSTPTGEYRSHSIHSDDGGKTWAMGGTIAPNVNECQVVELPGGKLLMNLRNYAKGEHARRRAISTSDDGGATWSPVTYDATLIESICQASLIRLTHPADAASKGILLFSNPASDKSRNQMTVRLSRDGGKTWPVSKLLFAGHAAYSNLIELPDGSLACFYERGEKSAYDVMVFHRFRME